MTSSLIAKGKTTDEKTVLGGVFKLQDTHGVHLSTSLLYFQENDYIVDWIDFATDALNAGWNPRTIISTVHAALLDSYSDEYATAVTHKLQDLFEAVKDEN